VEEKKRGRPREYTTGQAAKVLSERLGRHVSTEQVRRWIASGKLGGSRLADSWYRTTDRDIAAFIEANTRKTLGKTLDRQHDAE